MDAQTLKQQIATAHEKARADEGYWLGMAAFRYGFPLLEMHRSLWEWHVDTSAPTHLGAINEIHHTPRRAEPGDTYFVTPIVDAPYSRTFVDLSGGAVVLAVPPVTDRYFTVQLLDMYTNSFAYVGTRMGDTTGGDFLPAGPGWRGTVPDGITRVITAPTPPRLPPGPRHDPRRRRPRRRRPAEADRPAPRRPGHPQARPLGQPARP